MVIINPDANQFRFILLIHLKVVKKISLPTLSPSENMFRKLGTYVPMPSIIVNFNLQRSNPNTFIPPGIHSSIIFHVPDNFLRFLCLFHRRRRCASRSSGFLLSFSFQYFLICFRCLFFGKNSVIDAPSIARCKCFFC